MSSSRSADSTAASPPLSHAAAPPMLKTPAFLSPEPAAPTARELLQRTLSEGARKKQHKRKLMSRPDDATPTILRRKKKLPIGDTPQSELSKRRSLEPSRGKENEPNANRASELATATEKPRKTTLDGPSGVETATRRLEFAATPNKPEKTKRKVEIQPESSSSSSEDEDGAEHSSASSDECEVTFDAMTLGNLRIVREAVPSPLSTVSTASSSSKLIGLEYQFSLSSTVSSIAIAPDGKFLVAGFYNGTIYLYPLSHDSLRYRHGVMLDHISARGMYTQLMVRVSVPADGKFIFAGVYRGSTEIRAFEVDSIELPSLERLAQAASQRGTDDEGSDEDSDNEEVSGVPSARSISHTYSDAKLKGFSDVKSVIKKSNNKTEYQLLCGLGIKNIHLWRFYQDERAGEWAWECIFDKQNNGISIEMLCFHRDIDNQIIAKSEHQNIRIWNLEEDAVSGEMKKKSHLDVKQTVDAVAVYGDHAYGGGESLALIDLRTSSRMELDLPLSIKEQEAKRATARNSTSTRITASIRGRRSGTRGRGSAEDTSQRLMRMVSQVAGQDSAPFVVGMCTDGSVFMHRPQPETMGLATPLEYVEGYEEYFQDPSLSFQAQFSDLTRVNTSGLLSVLPLPKTEKEEWMVVAANPKQLLVRSIDAFLHRNEQKQDHMRVKRGLRQALHQMGNNGSSSESDSGEDSSSDDEPIRRKFPRRSSVDGSREGKEEKQLRSDRPKQDVKEDGDRLKLKSEKSSLDQKDRETVKPTQSSKIQTSKMSVSGPSTSEQIDTPAERQHLDVDEPMDTHVTNQVSTPVRKERSIESFNGRSAAAPSPVVSISSPSASSNPNTPERVKKLSDEERRSLVVKELEWTPQTSGVSSGAQTVVDNQIVESSMNQDANTAAGVVPTKRNRVQKRKGGKARSKGVAQALFVNDDADSNQVEDAPPVPKSSKRPAEEALESGPQKKLAVESELAPVEPHVDDDCTDVEDESELFSFTPLRSDGGSLLAAAMYQYSPETLNLGTAPTRSFNADEVQLLMRFSSQLERLKRSYNVDRERIMRQFSTTECDCATTKKKTGSTASKLNWRKQIASEASKKKHMKRRQKKLLASRLRDLQTTYEAKLSDIQIIQRLELQAFTARQEFLLLASQA